MNKKFIIGKRYSWCIYHLGGPRVDGLLERITDDNIGHFIAHNGDEWTIPLDAPTLELYKRESEQKKKH